MLCLGLSQVLVCSPLLFHAEKRGGVDLLRPTTDGKKTNEKNARQQMKKKKKTSF